LSIRKEGASVAELGVAWEPRSAWAGIAEPGRYGAAGEAGVILQPLGSRGMAAISVSETERERLAEIFASDFGVKLPEARRVEEGRALEVVWTGPNRWLALSRDRDLPAKLAERLSVIAAITDQSDSRTLMLVSGPRVRDALAKGCMIDLHSRVFGPGDAAATQIAHMNVLLWQADDAPTYCLATPRSMAGSFAAWLFASAAEFGYEIRPED
jgi:sarcosine oxidase subunit gamma